MVHSSLVKFLNRHTSFQLIFAYIPVVFIILYVAIFMYDVQDFAYIVARNDSILRGNMNSGAVSVVDSYRKDGTDYICNISGSGAITTTASYDEVIFTVNAIDDDWFELIANDSSDVEVLIGKGIIGVVSLEQLGFETLLSDEDSLYFSHDDNEISCGYGERLCDVILNKDGTYTVKPFNGESWDLDSIFGVSVLSMHDDEYDFEISSGYSIRLDSLNYSMCSILPTSDLYYDSLSKSLLRNTSIDLATNFIIGSNILVVLFSMTVYVVVLRVIVNKGELSLLNTNKNIIKINILALFTLVICIGFVYILF